MRVLLMSVVLTLSPSAFANTSLVVDRGLLNDDVAANSSVMEGAAAKEMIKQLQMRFDKGDSSVEMFSSELGRGVNNDIVLEEVVNISGPVGSESFECESHEFTVVQSSGQNDAEYTNSAVCYVK